MISDIDKAWTAGFFEGEGSIRIATGKSVLYMLLVEISQVDPSPLEWINHRWPGRTYLVKQRLVGNQRPAHRWTIIAGHAARFLADIQPFLIRDVIKKKVALALEFQAQKIKTHANRHASYRVDQTRFMEQMKKLNRRGLTDEDDLVTDIEIISRQYEFVLTNDSVERAALATRITAQ